MSRIEVEPTTLAETADRLRAAALDARRVCQALRGAGPEVTGSASLTAALREHADAWGFCLDEIHQRVRTAARTLHGAAAAYDRVERAIRDAAG